ncbi:hypothetical protein ABRR10_004586 [Escherichia coli]|nr:hypothetical protein [Escherichia coli]EFM9733948.1 hypothetical protein [Escherichia coli]EGF3467755.1 hypothetical protein [Escherichia coli]
MKQQHGMVLLEVVIFLILISLGYIGWMNVRKNISEFDYAMQVTRNLCFYKEKLGQYIKNNGMSSTSEKEVTFSDLGISSSSGYPTSYPEFDMKLYIKGKSGYIVLLRNNNLGIYSELDSITRMLINAAAGFLSVSLFPFNGVPKDINFNKNSNISGFDGYYTMKGIDLSRYNRSDVIAIVMVPETLTPFQECYYGF